MNNLLSEGTPKRAGAEIVRIGVVGGGLMGAGVAEVCARSNLQVLLSEVSQHLADAAAHRIDTSLARAVTSKKIDQSAADEARSKINIVIGLDELADSQIVIEAATEDVNLKLELFNRLDTIVTGQDSILASNTSSIPISKIASATSRPYRVIGLHFFNPATTQRLVEITPGLLTSAETTIITTFFAETRLDKTVVRAKDRAGFIVNALLVPYLLSAIRMYEAGHASVEDIDNGMILACNHPTGPLRLADLIGLDTIKFAAEAMLAEYAQPQYASPALLNRMVESKRLGRKTGQGFYQYD